MVTVLDENDEEAAVSGYIHITFSHLGDALIQSHLHKCIQKRLDDLASSLLVACVTTDSRSHYLNLQHKVKCPGRCKR